MKCQSRVLRLSSLNNVLRATLINNEVYALDMTAAQYGWHEFAVMPWPTSSEEKVDIMEEVLKVGETARALNAEAQAASGGRIVHQGINEQMEEGFDRDLGEWQRNNTSFKAMLCSEEALKTKQHSLLGFMDERMSKFHVDLIRVQG